MTLKRLLTVSPVVAYVRPDLPFQVYCDASAGTIPSTDDKEKLQLTGGLGAVLVQRHEDGKERVVGYASRSLRDHEKNYSAYLLELAAVAYACDQYHHYVYGGKKFTVYSDHKPLQNIFTKIQQKTRDNLLNTIANYNFDLVYYKGENQLAADCLSRNAVDAIDEVGHREWNEMQSDESEQTPIELMGRSSEEIRQIQGADPFCQAVRRVLRGEYDGSETDWCMKLALRCENDLYEDTDGLLYKNVGRFYALIIPRQYVLQTIQLAHDSFIGGHRSTLATHDRIRARFFWPTMKQDIDRYILTCQSCQRNKLIQQKTVTAPLKPLDAAERFNQRVHADLVGPLQSTTPNKHILVMTDAFSKWVELIPIPDKSAETVAKAIHDEWICRHSAPEMLFTDNGTEFKNQVMAKLCEYLNVKQRFTAPYHPQSNASAERFNRTMITYLRKYITDRKALEWEELLPAAQLSYNTQVHSSTGYSPYYLVHFFDPSLPFGPSRKEIRSYSEDWATEAVLRMQDAWKHAYEKLQRTRQTMKKYHDTKASTRKFNPGDLVCIKNDIKIVGANNKLTDQWLGPFKILEILGDSNALIIKNPRAKPINVSFYRLAHWHDVSDEEERISKLKRFDNPSVSIYTDLKSTPNTSKRAGEPIPTTHHERIPPDSGSSDDEFVTPDGTPTKPFATPMAPKTTKTRSFTKTLTKKIFGGKPPEPRPPPLQTPATSTTAHPPSRSTRSSRAPVPSDLRPPDRPAEYSRRK